MKSASNSFSTSLLRSGANILYSAVQVCILGWHWNNAIWSSYQSRAYPRVSKRRHPGLPLRRRSFSLSLKLGVLFRSSIPSSNLLGWSQLLVVFLIVWEWVSVHWSPMCGFFSMLGQLDSTLLLELGLLWFLLLHGLLETSPSSDMLTSLLLVCWVQVFLRWCCTLKGNQLWGNQFPWWLRLGKFLQSQLKWRCL